MICYEEDFRIVWTDVLSEPPLPRGRVFPDIEGEGSLLRELEDFRTKDEIQADDRAGK